MGGRPTRALAGVAVMAGLGATAWAGVTLRATALEAQMQLRDHARMTAAIAARIDGGANAELLLLADVQEPAEQRHWMTLAYRVRGIPVSRALSGHTGSIGAARFSPDGAFLVTASDDRTARLWSTDHGRVLLTLDGNPGPIRAVDIGPHGLILATTMGRWVALAGAGTGEPLGTLKGHTDDVHSVRFGPRGDRVVTASRDATARIWELPSRVATTVLRGHRKALHDAQLDGSGERVVTASADRTARVWDATSGAPLAAMRGHRAPVSSARFSPDGTLVVTASWDQTARIWDAVTGEERLVFRGHRGDVSTAAFHPSGRLVVSASLDGTARMWDPRTGAEHAVIRGHTAGLTSAAFDASGSRLVTTSTDGTARVWPGNHEALQRVLRDGASPCLTESQRVRYLAEPADLAAARTEACERACATSAGPADSGCPADGAPLQPDRRPM